MAGKLRHRRPTQIELGRRTQAMRDIASLTICIVSALVVLVLDCLACGVQFTAGVACVVLGLATSIGGLTAFLLVVLDSDSSR